MKLCIRGCGKIATIPKVGGPRKHSSWCMACWSALPANRRAQSTSQNPRRRAKLAAFGKRKIWIGARYVGYAKSEAQAQIIRAHIKGRLDAFQRQQARAKTEVTPTDPVSFQAGD